MEHGRCTQQLVSTWNFLQATLFQVGETHMDLSYWECCTWPSAPEVVLHCLPVDLNPTGLCCIPSIVSLVFSSTATGACFQMAVSSSAHLSPPTALLGTLRSAYLQQQIVAHRLDLTSKVMPSVPIETGTRKSPSLQKTIPVFSNKQERNGKKKKVHTTLSWQLDQSALATLSSAPLTDSKQGQISPSRVQTLWFTPVNLRHAAQLCSTTCRNRVLPVRGFNSLPGQETWWLLRTCAASYCAKRKTLNNCAHKASSLQRSQVNLKHEQKFLQDPTRELRTAVLAPLTRAGKTVL